MFKKNKGFSLVEVLLVLGFAAVLIAGAFLAYSQVKSSNSVNSEVQAAATMSAGVRSLFSGSPNYADLVGGDAEQLMIQANIVPENKVNAAGDGITHDLGGTTQQITVSTVNSDTAFTFTYSDVPESQCSKFVSAVAPSFNAVSVGGTSVKAFDGDLNVATMTTNCSGGPVDVVLTSD